MVTRQNYAAQIKQNLFFFCKSKYAYAELAGDF